MPMSRPLALVLAATLAADPALALQAAPATSAAQPTPTFAVGTSAVAIDLVVRDKKTGRLVKDLTAADFELSEDGVKQQIETFTVVARGAEAEPEAPAAGAQTAKAAPAAPAAAPAVPTQETADSPAILALVFDRLSAGGRDTSRKAALTYLSARHDGDFVGIFTIDLALHTIQSFTADADRIRTAIDLAGTQAGTSFASSTQKATDLQTLEQRALDGENTLMSTPTGGGAGSSGPNAAAQQAGAAAAAAAAARLEVGMIRSFEALERDQQGFATSNGLMAVIQGLQRVPGRKTIVFFSEGMAIPDRVLPQFQAVIAAANRANVAVYTVDAGGLRTHSPTEQARVELEAAAERRMRSMGREDGNGIMMKDAERNEDLLRQNPQSGLGQLAEQTGGFLVRDTNDARGSFRQIAQDMRFHYVIGYTPSNDNWDGRFRTVSVKVRPRGLEVHSRRGYLALRGGTSNPVLSYEAPAIAVLDRSGPRPEGFPFRGLALTFPTATGSLKVPVLVRVPGRTVKYVPAPGQKDVQVADLVVVVRVRNEYRQEVSRLSQHYQLSSPSAKLEAARAGDILFYREAELPPGKYTLDAVAYDATSTISSVKSFPLEVPSPGPTGAALSSLVVIDHVERVPAGERDPKNPLYFGDTLVYPSMGDPLRRAAKIMGFYFTAQAPASARKALLEITRAGQVVNRLTLDLPAPDASGRIQHAGTLPLDLFTPGDYELRVTLLDGTQRLATRSTSLAVAE